MARFTDHTGQEWVVRLTVGSVSDVKKETGVNLALASKDTSWIEAIFGDPGKLVEILYVLCEEQCKAKGISPEEFARRFDGPTLDAAGAALCEGIADFFPRSAIARAVKTRLAAVMAEADRKAVALIEGHSTDSPKPTGAPESSVAIPAG